MQLCVGEDISLPILLIILLPLLSLVILVKKGMCKVFSLCHNGSIKPELATYGRVEGSKTESLENFTKRPLKLYQKSYTEY